MKRVELGDWIAVRALSHEDCAFAAGLLREALGEAGLGGCDDLLSFIQEWANGPDSEPAWRALTNRVHAAVANALAHEREVCAALVETLHDTVGSALVAKAIRARGDR